MVKNLSHSSKNERNTTVKPKLNFGSRRELKTLNEKGEQDQIACQGIKVDLLACKGYPFTFNFILTVLLVFLFIQFLLISILFSFFIDIIQSYIFRMAAMPFLW